MAQTGHSTYEKEEKLPWQVKLFMISLLLPLELGFSIANFRLTGYRVFLIVFFIPCLAKTFNHRNGGNLLCDKFLLLYSLWMIFSLSYHHGFANGIESGGILMVESFGAYLVARTYLTNLEKFKLFIDFTFKIIVLLLCVTIPETLTGFNIVRPNAPHIGQRLGLERAFGPFEHAILYGVFCASLFSLFLFVGRVDEVRKRKNDLRALITSIAAFVSISSGALATVFSQFILCFWERITRSLNARWRILGFLFILLYFFIDLLSNRSPMRVFLHRLTFSAHTAYNRLTIWEYGTKYNVAEHPIMGIGLKDWVRPSWMHSSSMDNFWLVNMVRYGLPAFFFLAAAILYILLEMRKAEMLKEDFKNARLGWVISILGVCIAGCTVHFWNMLYVWFFYLLGSGVWLICIQKGELR